MEKYTQEKLFCRVTRTECDDDNIARFFGEYSSDPEQFVFSANEKVLIWKIVNHVKYVADEFGHNSNLAHFVFGQQTKNESLNIEDKCTSPQSHTHKLLNKLIEIADKNYSTTKPGYRFDDSVKKWAAYLRMIAGPLAYQSLQKNLELCLPSLSATNRYVRKMNTPVYEGELQSEQLLQYLSDRSLPLVVSLSEDATRIDGRVQYNALTNLMTGFVQPIAKKTGLPITRAYQARTAKEILEHFQQNHPISQFVNVMMAQPLANVAPFCLLVYGTDMKYTSEDIINRWNFIIKDLQKYKIRVINISTDSDPKYNSAMRKKSTLGECANIFDYINRFTDDISIEMPFFTQDTIHIATKLRNWLLRTINNPKKFPFGSKYYMDANHLKYLLRNISKDQHELCATTLNPIDKQNYASVERICDDRVINLLGTHVKGSSATIQFLKILRAVIETYTSSDISPTERIKKIWTSVFLIRIWRNYVESRKVLTLKKNFLTQNCYACIEINAHSLLLLVLYLRENESELFLPHLFSSQPCEAFFRQIRSFSSTYSTVANCSVKEILGRIYKIHLQNDIALSTEFVFPRVKSKNQFFNNRNRFELPPKHEIFKILEECRDEAINIADCFGMYVDLEDVYFLYECAIPPLKMKPPKNFNEPIQHEPLIIHSLLLKSFGHKIPIENINEHSPYVVVECSDGKKVVVKKTSLCWLLRKNHVKLSSDRIYRVRAPHDSEKSVITKKCKYKRYGLLYKI